MRKFKLSILLATSIAFYTPAYAETDLGKVISGIAETLLSQEADRAAYSDAQRRNTADGYRGYLRQFPKGAFRVNAEQALAKLGASVDPSNPGLTDNGNQSAAYVEASIGLSRTQRILIQKQLTSIGYSTGVADGLWGRNTRDAISRWQTTNKVPASGYVTAPQIKLIARQAGSNVGDEPSSVAGDDPIEERLLGLTYSERRDVQRRLTLLGHDTRGVDGSFGANTRRALASWQRDEGLRPSGYLTADQLRALRRQSGG